LPPAAQDLEVKKMSRTAKLNNGDLQAINIAAQKKLPAIASRWLPDGRLEGRFWVARNPYNDGEVPPSLQLDLKWAAWNDYTLRKSGKGAISLAAYLARLTLDEAAARLAKMLGVQC
jgi:hypothetical protein